MEPEETEGNSPDKSINIITEIIDVTDRRNHLTMKTAIEATDKNYRGYRVTC